MPDTTTTDNTINVRIADGLRAGAINADARPAWLAFCREDLAKATDAMIAGARKPLPSAVVKALDASIANDDQASDPGHVLNRYAAIWPPVGMVVTVDEFTRTGKVTDAVKAKAPAVSAAAVLESPARVGSVTPAPAPAPDPTLTPAPSSAPSSTTYPRKTKGGVEMTLPAPGQVLYGGEPVRMGANGPEVFSWSGWMSVEQFEAAGWTLNDAAVARRTAASYETPLGELFRA